MLIILFKPSSSVSKWQWHLMNSIYYLGQESWLICIDFNASLWKYLVLSRDSREDLDQGWGMLLSPWMLSSGLCHWNTGTSWHPGLGLTLLMTWPQNSCPSAMTSHMGGLPAWRLQSVGVSKSRLGPGCKPTLLDSLKSVLASACCSAVLIPKYMKWTEFNLTQTRVWHFLWNGVCVC